MTIDLIAVQLFVGGLVVFAGALGIGALLAKPPRTVVLTMHVDRGRRRSLDIEIRGAADDDLEAMLAGVARRIAGDDPAAVRVDRVGTPAPVA